MITLSLLNILGITFDFGDMGALFSKAVTLAGTIFALLLLISVLRAIFRKLPNDLPLVSLEVSRIPLLLITTLVGVRLID